VYPVPEALFTASPLIASNVNPTFDFEAIFGNSGCYFDFGDGSGDSSCLASHTYSDTGIYTVTLYTSNPGGCADTFSLTVEVRPNYSLYLPSAFSPNNDQINDRFEVFAEGVQKFNMQVYNRFGQLVYKSDSTQESWNGKWLNDGEECPVSVYVYEAEVTDYNRKKHNLRGRITLIR
jgi:gliding motility-associated-like protein